MHRSICQAFKHEYPLITPSPPPRTAPPQIGISKTVIAFSAGRRKGFCYMIHVKLMSGILLGLKASLDHRLCRRTQFHMVFFWISCNDQCKYYNRGAQTGALLTLMQVFDVSFSACLVDLTKRKITCIQNTQTFTTQYSTCVQKKKKKLFWVLIYVTKLSRACYIHLHSSTEECMKVLLINRWD